MTFAAIVQKAEADVEAFIQKVVQGAEHVLGEIEIALGQSSVLVSQGAAVVSEIAPFVEGLGAAAGHPEVVAGVEAANVAMQGLNAFMQTFKKATTGGGVTASEAKGAIVGAYQSYRNVVSTYNSVKATAVKVATSAAPAK
jgi:hypothetical protein